MPIEGNDQGNVGRDTGANFVPSRAFALVHIGAGRTPREIEAGHSPSSLSIQADDAAGTAAERRYPIPPADGVSIDDSRYTPEWTYTSGHATRNLDRFRFGVNSTRL